MNDRPHRDTKSPKLKFKLMILVEYSNLFTRANQKAGLNAHIEIKAKQAKHLNLLLITDKHMCSYQLTD